MPADRAGRGTSGWGGGLDGRDREGVGPGLVGSGRRHDGVDLVHRECCDGEGCQRSSVDAQSVSRNMVRYRRYRSGATWRVLSIAAARAICRKMASVPSKSPRMRAPQQPSVTPCAGSGGSGCVTAVRQPSRGAPSARRSAHLLGEVEQRLGLKVGRLEICGVSASGPVYPGGAETGPVGAVDVPRMGRN